MSNKQQRKSHKRTRNIIYMLENIRKIVTKKNENKVRWNKSNLLVKKYSTYKGKKGEKDKF